MDSTSIQTEALWRQLHDRLRAFVRRRVRSEHDAEDIVQDVFVRIHDRLASVRDSSSLVSWVFTIARHAITDHHRARSRSQSRDGATSDALELTPDSDDANDDREAERALAECIRPFSEQLPEAYRRALELTELEGKTHAEAAEELGLSVSGVKSRVQRGRAMVRDLLNACCTIELDRRKGVVDYQRRSRSCGCGSCGKGG